jgi:hypothetical protein
MKFKIDILGYGDEQVLEKAHLLENSGYNMNHKENYLPLFVGYSNFNIKVGSKIKTLIANNKLMRFIDLEILSVYPGFGEAPIKKIPKGFKSIILVKGKQVDIFKLKESLNPMKGWHEGDKVCVAIGERFKTSRSIPTKTAKTFFRDKHYVVWDTDNIQKTVRFGNLRYRTFAYETYIIKPDMQHDLEDYLENYPTKKKKDPITTH